MGIDKLDQSANMIKKGVGMLRVRLEWNREIIDYVGYLRLPLAYVQELVEAHNFMELEKRIHVIDGVLHEINQQCKELSRFPLFWLKNEEVAYEVPRLKSEWHLHFDPSVITLETDIWLSVKSLNGLIDTHTCHQHPPYQRSLHEDLRAIVRLIAVHNDLPDGVLDVYCDSVKEVHYGA